MRKSELNSYLSFAKKLINVSEKIVKQNTPSKIKVNFKIDRSPVTKIDMQVERSLRKLISQKYPCLLYTSPSPRDKRQSRMPSSA